MKVFPPPRVGFKDETDVYGTYTEEVAQTMGIVPFAKQERPETPEVVESKVNTVNRV